MPRKITVTSAELEALRWISERSGIYDESKEGAAKTKALGKLLQKAEKAHAPVEHPNGFEAAAHFSELESILLTLGGTKVVKMARLTAREYVFLARDIKERGVTADQMRIVAPWVKRQAWLKMKVTLQMVLKHWGAWYGRAQSEGELQEKPRGGPVMLGGYDDEE